MNTENHTNSGASANGSFPTITILQTDMDECKAAFTVGGVKAYETLCYATKHKNGRQDLDGDDEGAAEVGVTETTMESRSYSHQNNEMMKFWDLPGVVIKELLHEVRANLQENLGNLYEEGIVFLIDSYERNKFDFALLAQRLVEDFPGLKRQAFIFSMNTFSEQMVRVKAQELRSTLWQYSSLSGLAAIAPLPGLSASVDCALIIKASKFFYNQLGLGDLSLQKIAYFTKTNSVTLQNIAKEDRDVDKLLTVQGIEQIIRNTPALMISAAVEEYLHVFPYGGSVVAAPLSFGTTYYILNFILNKMEEVVLRVVKTAAENASINATNNE
ncbi:hypothetical protein I4U23_031506 [Adineta vaga]|nr:hypothetical protein I4U23_031506 [Adineta vaga]